MSEQSTDGTERQPHEYDVDKRFAHIRVDVLGQRYTDVVRVCEQFPDLPDGITVYVDHIDAIDLKQENSDESNCYPRVKGECLECGSRSLFVGKGGYVTCGYIGCPNPSAPSDELGACNVDTDTEQ